MSGWSRVGRVFAFFGEGMSLDEDGVEDCSLRKSENVLFDMTQTILSHCEHFRQGGKSRYIPREREYIWGPCPKMGTSLHNHRYIELCMDALVITYMRGESM